MNRYFLGSFAFGMMVAAAAAADAPATLAVRSLDSSSAQSTPAKTAADVAPPASPAATAVSGAGECSAILAGTDSTRNRALEPYGSFEYLVFKIRNGPAPPLVSIISPQAANTAIQTGNLPPNSVINIANQFGTDPGTFSGIKAMAGLWLDECATWGVEVGYNQLFRQSDQFSIASGGIPVIGRPYFDVAALQPAFLRYTDPNGLQRGYIRTDAPSQLVGGDINVRYNGLAIFADRTEYLLGFRYMNLREAVGIQSGVSFFAPTPFAPVLTQAIDSTELFRAKNDFYGAQIGSESHFYYGKWSFDVGGKLAMGTVRQDVQISGASIVTTPGQPTQYIPNESALYVQRSNAGQYDRYIFGVLPEFFLRAGYQVTSRVRATVGYDLIGLSNVIRAGSAIDGNVNPNLTPFIVRNQPSDWVRPIFGFQGSDFWAQGLTLGLTVNY